MKVIFQVLMLTIYMDAMLDGNQVSKKPEELARKKMGLKIIQQQ